MLADAVNVSIVRLLAKGALPVTRLPEHLGPVSRTTRFSRLRELEELGIIVREKEGGSPPLTHCMLSPAGRELMGVIRLLRRWLKENPNRSLGSGDLFGMLETRALAIGWNSTVFRWLAERPYSLTELNAQSPSDVSYHELRKAREALSETGLIAAVVSGDRGQPYELTDWTRRAAPALAAAVRWERDFLPSDDPDPTSTEVETLLRLFIPSHALMAPSLNGDDTPRLEGPEAFSVIVGADPEAISTGGKRGSRVGQISGSLASWLDALVDGRSTGLQMKGGIRLTTDLLERLRRYSYPQPVRQSPL
jgi:DNA-binding HxlR family transcriptional regulator